MSRIDFIGIGAPKCGTTWLSAQLEAHPQIGFATDKEVYYFADTIMRRLAGSQLNCFARGEAWYHKQFPSPGGGIISRGEFCPSYLYLDEAADRIKAYFNSQAQKYEPLAPNERQKWEAYYAADQEELSQLLRGLQVID